MPAAPDRDDPLEAALAAIVANAGEHWDRVQGATPEVIYHYTDIAGLIGITSSGALWATNLRFMNDASELTHSYGLMLRVLADARAQGGAPAQVELMDEIERAIRVQWAGYPDFYAVSFSANGDLLSQWRGYGSLGGGYAIGFDTRRLACPPSPHPQPARFLNRVIYDPAVQLGVLENIATAMLGLFAAADSSGEETTAARARVFSTLGEVAGFAFNFKDPAWSEEQEWRGVYVLPEGQLEGVRFRPAGGVAVPFVSLRMGADDDGRLPIREVVVGPTLNAEMAMKCSSSHSRATATRMSRSSCPRFPCGRDAPWGCVASASTTRSPWLPRQP
ncbi:MAG: DUF2971 domain-containing protein [Dehalococcoidia bacterium]